MNHRTATLAELEAEFTRVSNLNIVIERKLKREILSALAKEITRRYQMLRKAFQ